MFSQNDPDPYYLFENIPKAPEAGTLGEYGDVTNNPYTGKANVTVPIYAINFEGLKIPIQLSYDTGGVMVAAEASWVGLNWSLSANFGISRTVNGKDDFADFDYGDGDLSGYIYNSLGPYDVSGLPEMDINDLRTIHLRYNPETYGRQNVDTQPDIFDVSLFGQNYKFRLDRKGSTDIIQTHVFNDPNVIITYDLSDESFTITDDGGYVYRFITKDYSTGYGSTISSDVRSAVLTDAVSSAPNRSSLSQITSWKLDKITSPRKRELIFNYQESYSFTAPNYSGSVASGDYNTWSGSDINTFTASPDYTSSTALMFHHYLSSISGEFGSVEFITSDREDIMTGADINALAGGNMANSGLTTKNSTGTTNITKFHGTTSADCLSNPNLCLVPQKLDAIRIKDYNGDQVLQANLVSSYFNASATALGDRALKKRLKLDELQINDRTFSFEYESTNSLPSKDSDDADFWGYYNDADNDLNSRGNVPRFGRFVVTEDVSNAILRHRFIHYNGAIKNANFNAAKKGSLNKITYPTGGSTVIDYEAHDAIILGPADYGVEYHTDGLIKWTSMTDEDLYNFSYIYLKMANESSYRFYDSEAVGSSSSGVAVYENEATFSVPTSAVIRSSGDLITEYDDTEYNGFFAYGDELARAIVNLADGSLIDFYHYNDWEDPIDPDTYATTTVSDFKVLTAGEYRLIQVVPEWDGQNEIPGIRVEFGTSSETGGGPHYTLEGGAGDPNGEPTVEQFEIGGLRVSAITNFNNDGSFINKKSYDYRLPNNDTALHSSGVLMNELQYFSKAYGFYSYDPRNYGQSSQLRFTSNNNLRTESSAQGSHIGYSNTQEYILDQNDNVLGSIERSYYNKSNQPHKVDISEIFIQTATTSCNTPRNSIVTQNNVRVLDLNPYSFSYVNGNVIKQEVYSADNRKMNQTNYGYYITNANEDSENFVTVMGLFADPEVMDLTNYCYSGSDPSYQWPDRLALHQVYAMPESFWKKALTTRTESIEFFDDGQYRTLSESSYNPNTLHLKSTRNYLSENDFTTRFYQYFYESSNPSGSAAEFLVNANRLSEVASVNTIRQYIAESSTLNERAYSYDFIGAPIDYPMVDQVLGAKADENLEELTSYQVYDDDGNVLQVQSRNGIYTAYVWGYNNQYVIAKIENKTWTAVSSLASAIITASNNDDDTCLAGGGCSEATLLSALDTFRNDASMSDAMITTYSYDPLIGVTSIKDPSDNIVYYLYDAANRLEEIRDRDGFLVQKYEYNITDDLIPLIVYDEPPGGDPDEDADGCVGSFCDGAFKTLAQFKAEDRTLDENGNKHLFGSIVVDEFPTNNILNITYKILPYGGSGNYEYRWRIVGDDFGQKLTTTAWSTPYSCAAVPDSNVEVLCEIEDTVTGKTYEVRLKHAVNCQN